jgi:glycosyltransferase involved in cell wall biosynthesis
VKRLLVVANPYPPAESAGTTRVLRLLRHLPDHGWAPTVLAPATRGTVPAPAAVPVVRTVAPTPRRLQGGGRRATRVNRWLFVPDPFVTWVPGAVAAGRRLLREQPFDAVLSSQPRASAQLVAAVLARLCGLPWFADYRDPWTTYAYRSYATPLHRAAHERLEAWTLRHAAAVGAVNQPILDDLVARHPWLGDRAHLMPNGFDARETADDVALGPGFWFVYTGRLYWREEPTLGFLTALATLPDDVKVLFDGAGEERVRRLAGRAGVGARVRVEPFAPHERALGLQRAADALLLVTGTRAESMSSKVFEYLASGRPLFAVTAPHSAASALVAEVGGAVTVPHDAELAAPLAAFVSAVRAGNAPVADVALLARYNMARVTAELAAVLDVLVRDAARRPSAGARAGRDRARRSGADDGKMSP